MKCDTSISDGLLAVYHNNPTVHYAVNLWRSGVMSKQAAYEQAMLILAKELDETHAQLTEAFKRGYTPAQTSREK